MTVPGGEEIGPESGMGKMGQEAKDERNLKHGNEKKWSGEIGERKTRIWGQQREQSVGEKQGRKENKKMR